MTSDEPKREERSGSVNNDEDATKAPEPVADDEPPRGWLAQLRTRLARPAELSREAKSGERTRGLVILAGTTIVCIFLFFGLFTTDSTTNRKEWRTTPSLGRPNTATVNPETATKSPVPQLSVNQQPNDESGELSEQDVLGTMRNRGTPKPVQNVPPPPPPKPPPSIRRYRQQAANVSAPTKPIPSLPVAPAPAMNPSDALKKSSIVFVRASAANNPVRTASAPGLAGKSAGMLAQGTALVARLQHSVSSAAKVPVTAVIEYNYEESGQLVVPAGTRAYGELSQATPQGWVSMKFLTLEFPNGEQEQINGSAISMERTALRGDVNGKNTAKKFLTRTLTGIGTIAAFAVGGRGLTSGINNSILLRERLASNVALAGEQELATLSYQQNIVVTVPANTRFYIVLHEAGISRPPEAFTDQASQLAGVPLRQASTRTALSDQDVRELLQLRNELREMNRLMQMSAPKPESRDSQSR